MKKFFHVFVSFSSLVLIIIFWDFVPLYFSTSCQVSKKWKISVKNDTIKNPN